MKKVLFIISIILVVAAFAVCLPLSFAQASAPTGGARQYLSSRESEFVGAAYVVVDILSADSYADTWGNIGYADRENQALVDDDTVFDWGELSELLVWSALDLLEAEGKLDLDAKVSNYVAGVSAPKGEPTVNDLITHQSGFASIVGDLYVEDDEDVKSLAETVKNPPKQLTAPREQVAYSAFDATLGAYIVEVVARQPYAEFVQENLLDAIGMQHTAVSASLWENAEVHTARNLTMTYTAKGELAGRCRRFSNYYPAISAAGTLTDLYLLARYNLRMGSERALNKNGDIAWRVSTIQSSQAAIAVQGDMNRGKLLVALTNSPNNELLEGLVASEFASVEVPQGFYRPTGKVARTSSFAWTDRLQIKRVSADKQLLCLCTYEDGSILTADGLYERIPLHEV
ncbi:MAG: beta-lactamase family protein, partial [Clostridia bacterium]|nr:beta-lactamase family protein [Clostridia bacterium]